MGINFWHVNTDRKQKSAKQIEAESAAKRAKKYSDRIQELNDAIKFQSDRLKDLTPGSSEYNIRKQAIEDLIAERNNALIDLRKTYAAQGRKEDDSKPDFTGPDKYNPAPIVKGKIGRAHV